MDENPAMVAVGVALITGGFLSTGMYAVISYSAKKYDERFLLIAVGMVPTVIGTFLYLPLGDRKIKMQICNSVESTTIAPVTSALPGSKGGILHPRYDPIDQRFLNSGDQPNVNCTPGCPIEQTWCEHVPMLPVAQLVVAYVITISAFPVIQALCQTIFSKMLGPKPQGVWFGILTGVGSLARVLGPVFVSYIYTFYGTYWTFGILEVGLILALIELIIMYPRLIPMKIPLEENKRGYDNIVDENEL